MTVFQKMPEFLAKSKYQNPIDSLNATLQLAMNTKEHAFAWLNQQPELLKQFANHMGGTTAGLKTWIDPQFYPLEENLSKDATPGKDFFVDIGGSKGHDLKRLLQVYPKLPGRLILEDQPDVVKQATDLDSQIAPMGHDFFTEQPIKGLFSTPLACCPDD